MMAMKYNKIMVFIGSFGALTVMTGISTIGGKLIFSMIPKFYTDLIITFLFFYFGLKLFIKACNT